jgi:hypothetical protein
VNAIEVLEAIGKLKGELASVAYVAPEVITPKGHQAIAITGAVAAVLQRFLDQGMPLRFEEPMLRLVRAINGPQS